LLQGRGRRNYGAIARVPVCASSTATLRERARRADFGTVRRAEPPAARTGIAARLTHVKAISGVRGIIPAS